MNRRLFLPNIKLRDLDGATIVLKPLDPLSETVQFVKDILEFRGLKLKVMKHMKIFHGLFKGKLSWETMAFAQFNALLLCAPGLATAATDMGRIRLYGRTRASRTFVGYSEPLDPVYVPAFSVNSRYQHYFRPTMLTDQWGDIAKPLIDDLFKS